MAGAQMSVYKLIRSLWPKDAFVEQILKGSPALGLVRKDTNFGEKIRYVSVGTSPPQGISGDYGQAKRNKTASTAEEFQVATVPFYGSFSIQGDLYRRFKKTGNKALLVDPMARESKGLINQMKNDLSSFIHGNGGGALGRIASTSTLSSQTVTLDKGADKRRIQKGMTLWAATTDGTSGSVLLGEVTVASVGGTASAPTVTINETSWSSAIPGITTTSYLFRAGMFGTSSVIYGLDALLPDHSGSPGTLYGVNRNNAADQLAGQCMTATTKSPRQRILEASQLAADTGMADGPARYLTSTRNWVNLHNELTSSNALQMTKIPAAKVGSVSFGIEYDAISFVGPAGKVDVIADPWMPDNVERLLFTDTLVLASCGDLIGWDDGATPGDPMLEDAADAREVRAVGDLAFYCENPWPNVRVKLA